MLEEAKEVCPTTTRRLLGEGAILMDVRDRSEVTAFAFDVPDVVNIPLSELEQRCSEVPRDRPVVFVCDTGVRSLKATYFLQFHGYTNVSNMGGGVVKWSAKGFPVKGQRAADSCSTGCCSPTEGTTTTSCC
ncbi:MAG: rhodanese-like domain-containing protein [Sterolibacteriaceae bacterium]|uniref:Rhodanese-like domain-containing protein n=1 Tax=Candidatus Methylophosphatis roskildensis TaxID=2899263 RepID=A0A9D7HNF1_9PROT|nr:rhodanese-like domain-containing protein [Candidatus Methylophosphatis roskildensis]MBK7237994.1 rhodanese-like domain-containing protein [Sterolibacteriaceae bacterium]